MLVQGGPAGSGRKRVLREAARADWECGCGETQRSYVARCPRCREDRPEEEAHARSTWPDTTP